VNEKRRLIAIRTRVGVAVAELISGDVPSVGAEVRGPLRSLGVATISRKNGEDLEVLLHALCAGPHAPKEMLAEEE